MSDNVFITDDAERKLSAYFRLAEGEISGFGTIEQANGFLIVNYIFILHQVSGVAHTELDTDAMQELLYEMLKRGTNPEQIALWWHSHGTGGTFFSNVDDDTIERFAEFGRPWMLSLVGNRRLDRRLRLDFYTPIRATVEDISLLRVLPPNDKLDRRIEAEINRKVRKPPPTPVRSYPNAMVGYPWWQGGKGDGIEKEIAELMSQAPGAAFLED